MLKRVKKYRTLGLPEKVAAVLALSGSFSDVRRCMALAKLGHTSVSFGERKRMLHAFAFPHSADVAQLVEQLHGKE